MLSKEEYEKMIRETPPPKLIKRKTYEEYKKEQEIKEKIIKEITKNK